MPLNFAAKAAITVALTAANMALTMSRKIEGPRLDNLKFTGGDFGAPLPMVWGMRRMEVPIFWAEDLKEVKRRRKTKGGKFNEYTYFGTWAVALAGHEIEAVRRIWFDTHLVYDVSGAGPISPFDFGALGADISEAISVYLGTSTQEPDPRMQATVEAEFGEGSCPAYRDTAYIVFKDIPLEKIGNRIPQVSVEILGASGAQFPTISLGAMAAMRFAPDFSTFINPEVSTYAIYDTATLTQMVSGALVPNRYGAGNPGYDGEGNFYDVPGTLQEITKWDESGQGVIVGPQAVTTWGVQDANGAYHWFGALYPVVSTLAVNGSVFDLQDFGLGPLARLRAVFPDRDGGLWGMVHDDNDSTEVSFFSLTDTLIGLEIITATGLPSGTKRGGFHYQNETGDYFIISSGSNLYAIDKSDGSIAYSNATGPGVPHYNQIIIGSATIWAGFHEVDPSDLSIIRALDPGDWGSGLTADVQTIYDPINHALVVSGQWFFLDRVAPSGVTLSSIAGDIADMCGVNAYDFAGLDQEVAGWSATRGQASNMLEPLLDAYDSDIRPHDFGIQGVKRTGVATGPTITTAWLAGEPRYSVTIKQELPRALLIDFADIDAEQQPNTARADRPLDATDARGELKIDLTTLALDVDEAIQLANRHFRRRWNERQELSTGLTAKELGLEPGDVRNITLDGETRAYRCVSQIIRAGDSMETEWRYDHPSLATLDGSAGAAFDGRDPAVVTVPALSKGFVLDVPLLTDADAAVTPQVYPLAAPYADGAWPGATIYQAVDGEYSDELATKPSSEAATWGYVSTALPYANPNLWDRGTQITVTLQTGTLEGCTEAAANADPTLNLVAIGNNGRWELVQFTVATLTAPQTYTLSGFKRGRRGTEWAAELHEAGDHFVLLENADPIAMGLAEVNTAVSFKAITAARSTGFPFGYTYEGQSLKPYAPVNLKAVKEANGDWTFSWVRRTRVGGAWTGGSTIPLSEANEEYELTVGDGVTSAVKSPTSPSYTWTVAEQATDTGAEVIAGSLEWTVAQVSDAVGAGFIAAA